MLIYVEDAVRDSPRAREIVERLPKATVVPCDRYTEIFNRSRQDFRHQKSRKVLILAEKHDGLVLETPRGYGIGGERNFYFSHLLNCPYDCRYCFLQGMYRSAAWVLFVNYDDFASAIDARLEQHPGEDCYFFSGYDCDSLALEGLSGFAREMLPLFREREHAWLELRTKSTHVAPLLESEPFPRAVVAFSLTPPEFSRRYEHGVPDFDRRLDVMVKLAEQGWPLGLRFDPLFATPGFVEHFQAMIETLSSRLPLDSIHSVSLGLFRMPREFHRRIERLYPEEPLLAMRLEASSSEEPNLLTFPEARGRELVERCSAAVTNWVPSERLFSCS